MRHFFFVENNDPSGANWLLGTKICFFDLKIWVFGSKSQFFVLNRDFCQQGISPVCLGLQLSHSDHPQKFPFLSYGSLTLNFGPSSTKLDGTVRAIKKMTQNDNGPGLGQKYGEWPFNVRLKSVFWAKIAFYPKITPKIS